jgi:hypothetical protein
VKWDKQQRDGAQQKIDKRPRNNESQLLQPEPIRVRGCGDRQPAQRNRSELCLETEQLSGEHRLAVTHINLEHSESQPPGDKRVTEFVRQDRSDNEQLEEAEIEEQPTAQPTRERQDKDQADRSESQIPQQAPSL